MRRMLKNLLILAASLPALGALAQTPGISSMNNGWLTFTNIDPNLEYRVEWASSQNGSPFTASYRSMEYVSPTGGAFMTVAVPLVLRVAATNPIAQDVYRAGDTDFHIDAGTNQKVTVEWAETTNGPWQTTWSLPSDATVTGAWMNVPTPRFFRVNFINCPSNYHDCTTWIDATGNPALRTNKFSLGSYAKPCLKIRVGQDVTFSGNFLTYKLTPGCQDCDAIQIVSVGDQPQTFIFLKPGYYNYFAEGFAYSNGIGMAGNIWVVP